MWIFYIEYIVRTSVVTGVDVYGELCGMGETTLAGAFQMNFKRWRRVDGKKWCSDKINNSRDENKHEK